MNIKSKKYDIRKDLIKKRDNIEVTIKRDLDREIINRLKNEDYYKNGENIFVYIGFNSEIDTKIFINEALKDRKRIYVPKVIGREMILIKINSLENLVTNKYGILEPIGDKSDLDVNNLDLIIMPGVAFDRNGNRIGYGGGYYDRFLEGENIHCKRVALAYDFQILDNIESEEHDIKVNYIISEKRVLEIK